MQTIVREGICNEWLDYFGLLEAIPVDRTVACKGAQEMKYPVL
jgi:hypothetical protein